MWNLSVNNKHNKKYLHKGLFMWELESFLKYAANKSCLKKDSFKVYDFVKKYLYSIPQQQNQKS